MHCSAPGARTHDSALLLCAAAGAVAHASKHGNASSA
jgi:hypothetical protein